MVQFAHLVGISIYAISQLGVFQLVKKNVLNSLCQCSALTHVCCHRGISIVMGALADCRPEPCAHLLCTGFHLIFCPVVRQNQIFDEGILESEGLLHSIFFINYILEVNCLEIQVLQRCDIARIQFHLCAVVGDAQNRIAVVVGIGVDSLHSLAQMSCSDIDADSLLVSFKSELAFNFLRISSIPSCICERIVLSPRSNSYAQHD